VKTEALAAFVCTLPSGITQIIHNIVLQRT